MPPIQDPKMHSDTTSEPRRTQRTAQADRFEMLAAASETEAGGICLIWLTGSLSVPAQVSS